MSPQGRVRRITPKSRGLERSPELFAQRDPAAPGRRSPALRVGRVAPGRLDAPEPFGFSRIALPAAGDLLPVEVWAPRHDRPSGAGGADGEPTAPAFPVDRNKPCYALLAALCEPRLRARTHTPLPTVDQVVERLRPAWPAASRTSVQWNIDYLAVTFSAVNDSVTRPVRPVHRRGR